MTLRELVFREVNIVLVHSGVAVPAISLDRVRAARPSASMQVTSGPAALTILYPDERMVVQFDPQRVTVNDNSGRNPEATPIVETALNQHLAIGAPQVVAFGYNLRFDFEAEGLDCPGESLTQGILRDPGAIGDALKAGSFQAGLSLVYQRGVKLWSLRADPIMGAPRRLGVHANIHEDLKPPPASGASMGPPPPAWLEGAIDGTPGSELPGVEGMKGDLALQTQTTMATVIALLTLAARRHL
ncbi:MAG TPA: hypothetical protein VFJ58_11460 [Armatimonadota bacterium]|nr:hypothetical protein [Armatimonadota bacterium]